MVRAYSSDLRIRVIGAVEGGFSARGTGRRLGIGESTATAWMVGGGAPGVPWPSRRRAAAAHRRTPTNWRRADLTPEETRGLLGERGVRVGVSSVWRFFERHGISFKKTVHAAEPQRADVAAARLVWKNLQPWLDPRRLVFLDETGTATNMARRRRRCRRGFRLIGRVPHGHWKTTTFVAGLRGDGVSAPLVVDRAMNGQIFRVYVERSFPDAVAWRHRDHRQSARPQSRRGARYDRGGRRYPCSTCRPARPTLTRSRCSSPSSRRCCAAPPRAPSHHCGTPSAACSTTPPQPSAPAILPTPDTPQSKWKIL